MADGMPPHAMASLEGALTTALNAALRPEVATPTAQPLGDHAAILASVHQRETDVRAREAAVHEREVDVRAREAAVQAREMAVARFETAQLARREAELATFEASRAAGGGGEQAASMSKKTRHADPIDDVPKLVEQFQTQGGVVPLGVLVAEVEALQQASTKLQAMVDNYDIQLEQLAQRALMDMPPWMQARREKLVEKLMAEKDKKLASVAELRGSFSRLRFQGIERFTPLLLQSVLKFDAAFEGALDAQGEATLARIGELCDTVDTKGRELRQPLPSADPPHALSTLMLLMERAIAAGPRLLALAEDAISGCKQWAVVVAPPKPTKGVLRSLQKVQEEYDGDYTRILDYARITLVFESLPDLEAALGWLLATKDRGSRFVACRTKDRMSRRWDAEISGGNRDIMVNGWLELGGGRSLIVEVQLHLRVLFELKSDLHVLYAALRVLGAMEDATAKHDGLLNDDVIEKAHAGVVRKIHTDFSCVTSAQRERLAAMVQTEPCPLLELNVGFSKLEEDEGFRGMFDGWGIPQLIEPDTGTLACRRLRYLRLTCVGLCGELPPSIKQCVHLQFMIFWGNPLTGCIPSWIGELRYLRTIVLSSTLLSGPIPDEVGELALLEDLQIANNNLSGTVPVHAIKKLKKLLRISLGHENNMNAWKQSPNFMKYMTAHGLAEPRNADLSISAEGVEELKEALPQVSFKTWPAIIREREEL